MAGQNFTELKQEEVFAYIDKDLKKDRGFKVLQFAQKTKKNFFLVMIIDLVALSIAIGGFYIVYNIFKAGEYKLVGTEGSIKGLEDVLYKELQKKANLDLEKKQKELDEAKTKYNMLSSQLDSLKQDQQKILKSNLEKLQSELNEKMNQELKNTTIQQREAIRKKYEDELKSRESQMNIDAQKREEELKKQMESEKQKFAADESAREKELKQTQTSLEKVNTDLQNKILEVRTSSEKAMADLNSQLKSRQSLDDFNNQLNQQLKSAIEVYQKKEYSLAKERFNSINTFYQKRINNFPELTERKNIDIFFTGTLNDYIDLKESPYYSDRIKNEEKLAQLQLLSNFGNQLKKGEFNGKLKDEEKNYDQLSAKLPDVFSFYDNYDGFKKYIDDSRAETVLKSANNQFINKEYKKSISNYITILKNYPQTTGRNSILDRILLVNSGSILLDDDELNRKAEPLFSAAVSLYQSKKYDQAIGKFQEILTNYPNSKYTLDSVDYINKSYNNEFSAFMMNVSNQTALALELTKKDQNIKASRLYEDALKDEKSSLFDSAGDKYFNILIKYPLSDYLSNSLQGINRSFTAKYRQGTVTVQSAEFLRNSIGKIVDNMGDEIVLYLEKSDDFNIGSKVYIYRKENEEILRYIGDAVVTEFSPVMTKASIVKKVEDVHVGDLIYKK